VGTSWLDKSCLARYGNDCLFFS